MVHMYSMVLMLSSAYQIAAVKKCIQPNSQMHWIVQMSNFSVSYLTEKKVLPDIVIVSLALKSMLHRKLGLVSVTVSMRVSNTQWHMNCISVK